MNKRALIGVFVFLFLIIPAVYLSRGKDPKIEPVKPPTITLPKETIESLTQKILGLSVEDLPINKVENNFVTSSKGLAILLPQTHRSPGSEITDGINDAAVLVQSNLYQILGRLSALGVNMVAAEGDLSGPVPTSTFQSIAKKIELKNTFIDLKEKIKTQMPASADRNFVSGFYAQLDRIIAYLDRDVALSGAPYKLKAEGKSFAIIGAEDANTRAKSADIVRNYYYLNDRLTSLNVNSGPSVPLAQSSNMAILMQMLSASSGQNLGSYLKYFNSMPLGGGLKDSINGLATAYSELNEVRSQKIGPESNAPSRADNPYVDISDPKKIQDLLKQTTDKIADIVLNERNKDAAEIFAKNVSGLTLPVGIIQFGAEHKDGLIKELNSRGISVITISPNGLRL